MTVTAHALPQPEPRLAGYVRISDDRSGENASIQRQKKLIRDLASREGHDPDSIVWFEDRSRSASHGIRPAFTRLLTAVQNGEVDELLVWVADRLWRNDEDRVQVTKAFAAADVPVRAAMGNQLNFGTAEGRFMVRVTGAASSFETERKSERIVLAAKDRAEKGRYGGGTRRLGYAQRGTRIVRTMDEAGNVTETERPSGPLVLVPDEADALAWGYRRIASGGSLMEVTREWRRRGLVGSTGAGFTPQTVRQALLRPGNAGLSTYKGQIVGKAEWPAIIDEDTFVTVKAILSDPSRRRTRGRPPITLLTGILRCGSCGDPMRSSSHTTRGKIYRCQAGRERPDRPSTGLHSNRRQYLLDTLVEEAVLHRLDKNAARLTRPIAEPTGQVAQAVEEAARLRTKIELYLGRADQFSPEDLAGLLRGLRAKLADVEKKITRSAGTPATHALLSSHDVPAEWARLTVEGRRTVLKELIEKIVVGRAAPGRRATSEPEYGVEIVWRTLP